MHSICDISYECFKGQLLWCIKKWKRNIFSNDTLLNLVVYWYILADNQWHTFTTELHTQQNFIFKRDEKFKIIISFWIRSKLFHLISQTIEFNTLIWILFWKLFYILCIALFPMFNNENKNGDVANVHTFHVEKKKPICSLKFVHSFSFSVRAFLMDFYEFSNWTKQITFFFITDLENLLWNFLDTDHVEMLS